MVDAGADHSFDFRLIADGTAFELSRCGCWNGLTMTCQSGAIGPGSKNLACAEVHGACP